MKIPAIMLMTMCVLFCACRKTRVCECKITTNGTTTNTALVPLVPIDTSITTPLSTSDLVTSRYYKVTKREAKTNCFDRSEDVKETTTNSVPGLLSITTEVKGTRKYECTLK